MISRTRINEIIQEELSRGDVSSIANQQIDSSYKSREFKDSVKSVVADCLANFIKALYQRDSIWKNDVKR